MMSSYFFSDTKHIYFEHSTYKFSKLSRVPGFI